MIIPINFMDPIALGMPVTVEQKPPMLMIRLADHSEQITEALMNASDKERQFAEKEQEIQRQISSSEDKEAENLKPSEGSMLILILHKYNPSYN